ncbi:hypothetical protein IB277_21720 [Ensifer sp. ENS07]|uniref:caspase family protein n=1 Tax=Ensifer sp. ENS07 TaxID=2769274 RepID=UPI00177DEDC7|nr:caspase family protein [Ensifer sp. ENS07]MBD9638910.1 hypothetical protein [Ensifer sp. ENS07]
MTSWLDFPLPPGNVATDGDTGASPYATALAESVTIPGLSIEGVFKRVRATVQERTGGKQEPWENSAVYGDFQFVEGKSAEAGGDEVAFFEFAALADSQEAYQKYLSRYPEGMFASLARQKITFMDKDFSFRRQNETFRHFTFSTAGDDACGMGSFKAEQQTGDDIADGEIILLDLFFLYPDVPCKNTVFFDSLVNVDGSGFSKNRIQVLEPQKLTADYVTIDSCEGTCFGLQALVKARISAAEETRTYAFEVVSAAELGLTWKYQNTVSKLRETTATVSDGASAQPASLAFLETRTIAGWQVVAVVDPNRNLENCEASRIQDGGRRSVFRLYPYDLLTIGFTDPKRNFEEISGRPFTYRVDQSEMPFITRTQSSDKIAYQIEPTTKVIEALKAGAEINLHDGMLSLTGSRAMLSELQRCIAAFGG